MEGGGVEKNAEEARRIAEAEAQKLEKEVVVQEEKAEPIVKEVAKIVETKRACTNSNTDWTL